ncbi:uncharacterized protein LOC131737014 [Acipenser ruthenus]|uniref:uncharacterized protein LOC131737014 n=1 Tax=Acipenser ruthenus TaxID=7906 RepID=UPI0027418A18|nr:uncharacterized protein LOC131737014 [Acipenser ruthenus]
MVRVRAVLVCMDLRNNLLKNISFHRFPKQEKIRKEWVHKIRRDTGPNFQITANTRVCSKHFSPVSFLKTLTGKYNLDDSGKEGSTPSCSSEHDYVSVLTSVEDQLKAAQAKIGRLQAELGTLQENRFFLGRFQGVPQLITFYTGFNDYSTLNAVFLALQPTASSMVRQAQVQRNIQSKSQIKPDAFKTLSLPLIEQFFLFLCRVKQGLFEQDLAIRFNVSQSTVLDLSFVLCGICQDWGSDILLVTGGTDWNPILTK